MFTQPIHPALLFFMVQPDKIRFGGGVSESSANPIVLAVVVVAGLIVCTQPRRRAIAAFLATAVLIPTDQVLLVGGLHFPMMRVLILFGLFRLFREKLASKNAVFAGGMKPLDWAVLLLAIFTTINGVLLFPESAQLVFQFGNQLTALGSYFLLRHLMRDFEDVKRGLRVLAWSAVVVAVLMSYEQATGTNPYYVLLGGASANLWGKVAIRDGHFRATGCFGQPILAGTFGGILMPLFAGWWWKGKKDRKLALMGLLSATVISFAANSSTALFAFIGGLIGLCFWPLRRQMRVIRWAIASMVVGLHIVMKAPVWHLISRVSLTQGSDSEHRYQLVNQCILHFSSWWLIGTKSYASWGWDLWDLGNQYVAIADQSGLLPLICFLALFVYGFKYLGISRKRFQGDRKLQFFIWGFGSSLMANVVGFFGISYFDQTIIVWYALLAMIVAIYVQRPEAQKKVEPVLSVSSEPVTPQLAYAGGIHASRL